MATTKNTRTQSANSKAPAQKSTSKATGKSASAKAAKSVKNCK